MGEEPQRAEPVVEADPDDARFLDDLGHVERDAAAWHFGQCLLRHEL